MKFQAKTEKQLQEELLIPEGIYPYTVSDAESKQSKAGNEMIELQLRVHTNSGDRQLRDWLMEKMAFKLFHFCAYSGLSRQYESGTLTADDCVGRTGFVKIEIQEEKTGQYPARNSVRDYVRSADGNMPKAGRIATGGTTRPGIAQTEAQQNNEGPGEDVPW